MLSSLHRSARRGPLPNQAVSRWNAPRAGAALASACVWGLMVFGLAADAAGAPGAFSKSSPAHGATNVSRTPTVTWQASSGALGYEVCANTTASCAGSWAPVGNVTSVTWPGDPLDPGTTVFWQVRAVNATGTTYANSGTWWSFTTVPVPPGAFNKTSPANGAYDVSRSPTLTWGSSAGATSYEYCYDMSNDSFCSEWTSAGGNTSVGLSGLGYSTTYYWHVRAVNGGGTTYANGSSTAYWSFTTAPLPPAAFNKALPANGATAVSVSPTLAWGSSSGATSYAYCYDTTNDNACSAWTSTGASTNAALSGLSPGVTYYWQARASNAGGATYANGSETAYWSFTTLPLPGAFNKSSPANGATGVSKAPTLSWGASSGSASYEYLLRHVE